MVAAAGSLNALIVGRVVQAFGAGAVVPIAMALAGDLFPPERRAPALGFVGAVETIGWMIGHLYGGVLMQVFADWRLLFWLNVPIGVLALAATWWALRDVRTERAPGAFDWWGTLLLSGCLVALNVGLAAGADLGQADFYGERQGPPPYALPLVLASLGLLAAFVWAERRVLHPLFDITWFRQHRVAIACAINVLVGFALAMVISNVPLFIHTRLELFNPNDPDVLLRGAWDSGWMLSAFTLTMAGMATPGGWLTNRYGARLPLLAGLGAALTGFLLASTWHADTGYPAMAAQLVLAGCGLGVVISPVATLVINGVGEDHHGSASALVIILRLVGMTVGWSVLTLWGVQRQDMLRRAGATDPLASSDPALFLMNVAAQVFSETFLLGAGACLLALLCAALLRKSEP
jgi:MFS family permease